MSSKPTKRQVFWYLKDANGMTVASGSGTAHASHREAAHYMMLYAQEGPMKLSFRHSTKRKEGKR